MLLLAWFVCYYKLSDMLSIILVFLSAGRPGSTNWCLPPILNEKKKKTLWAVHHHLVRQAGYLLPALRSVLCLRLKLMLYPPQVVNISESKHDALKKVQRSWFPRFVFSKTKTIQFKIIRREVEVGATNFGFSEHLQDIDHPVRELKEEEDNFHYDSPILYRARKLAFSHLLLVDKLCFVKESW